jgi:hypothetical protein
MPKRSRSVPQMPRGKNSEKSSAEAPKPTRYHTPLAPKNVSITKKMTAPRIGPSNVPRPPTSVMKIM